MLTNFQSSFKSLLSAALISCLIVSCASQKPDKNNIKTVNVEQDNNQQVNAQNYLVQAKSLPTTEAIAMLVAASEQFLFAQENHQALWLANQTGALLKSRLTSELTSAQQYKNATLLYQLSLVKTASLQRLGYSQLAELQLVKADSLQKKYQLIHQVSYYQLIKLIAIEQTLQLDIIDAQLRILALADNSSDDEYFLLWQSLSQLSEWQIKKLARQNPPNFNGWQQLLFAANKWGYHQEKFRQALNKWQQKFKTHPANIIIGSLSNSTNITENVTSNIAVLLPLSGSQNAAGIIAQQGILAAYQDNTNKKIIFIDENNLDMTTLGSQLADKNIDFVIGPLLKSHVASYLNQQDITIPTLLLNLPGANTVLLPHQVALSMRREDEAIQAAASLSQKNYQYPLILSSKNSTSSRIAEAFAKQWQSINKFTPEIIYFQTGNKMQDDLKKSLSIDNSQQRINDVKRLFKRNIKTELRNRRDIDMIYLVANPKQTKLLKPYIDVNTSPFSSIIPVYASSLSHSVNDDKSDNRDLTGLVFTEIPWLLYSNQQNKKLANLSQALWPQRTDSLQRIFAMGYDSLFLADKIPAMQQASYIRHYGQTGVLKLGNDNILTRSLIWGRYRNNRVNQVIID